MTLLSPDEILKKIRAGYEKPKKIVRHKPTTTAHVIQNLPGEEWKRIFDGYEISNCGRVASTKQGTRKILKPNTAGKYLTVNICIDTRKFTMLIHRLVGQHFLDINVTETVTHIDGDNFNNHVSNLKVGKKQRKGGRRGISKTLGGNRSLVSNRISKGWCIKCAETIAPGNPGCTHK